MVFHKVLEIEPLLNSHGHNRHSKECLFYRSFASPRFYTAKTPKPDIRTR
jgi:hypothetical protein